MSSLSVMQSEGGRHMAIVEAIPVKKRPGVRTTESSSSSVSVQEMKRALGLDKIRPIPASPSTEKDLEEKGDPFKDWYEEELREAYSKRRTR